MPSLGSHECFLLLIITLVVVVIGFQVWLGKCGWVVVLFRCVIEKQNSDYPLGGTMACVNVSCQL